MASESANGQAAIMKHKPTKNQQRRAKKKQEKHDASTTAASKSERGPSAPEKLESDPPLQLVQPPTNDPIQDVPAITSVDGIPDDDPLYEQFADIFAKFRDRDEETSEQALVPIKPEAFFDDDDNIQGEDEEEETKKRLSKKARKAARRFTVAELKAIAPRPEVVEWTDINSPEPSLHVLIKSQKNVVPVPAHWSLKREYLSSKRGIQKPAYVLPKFISETGVSEMRDAVLEKQADASLKQRQRERVQPKMGKLDIDYQKLYDAFFRRQTKPHLTGFGEVYYEGKEFEINLRHLRPGQLSDELREALGMPAGAPPPWLVNQQKIGPPPSYPALKIPGVNAPIPDGATWGYQPGAYGKPPVDDQNVPLYGDIFGNAKDATEEDPSLKPAPVDKTLWGQLEALQEPGEEDEEEEEDDEEEEEEDAGDYNDRDDGADRYGNRRTGHDPAFAGTETHGGQQTAVPTDFGGIHSVAGEVNLRKEKRGTDTETGHPRRAAGQVLQERSIRAEGFFGGERAYDLGGSSSAAHPSNVPVLGSDRDDRGKKRKAGDVDVSMDPDALERDDRMTKDQISRQYEAQRTQQGGGGWQGGVDNEDLSGMVAEESAKRQKRDMERERRGKR